MAQAITRWWARTTRWSQPWPPQPQCLGCSPTFCSPAAPRWGHSGCPAHNRRSQNRAFQALQAFVMLAAQGDATDPMQLRTSWGTGHLSVNGAFIADAGWQAKMQSIQLIAGPQLTDPRDRLGGPSPTDWTSLASTLWHCTRLRWLSKGTGKNKMLHETMLEVTSVTLVFLSRGLIMWASAQSEPSTAELVACHAAGKKLHPALVSRLEKKRNPRSAARQWKEDGLRVASMLAISRPRRAAGTFTRHGRCSPRTRSWS